MHTDLVVPGNGGMDIRIQRAYSSNNVYFRPEGSSGETLERLVETTPYGVGWTLHFGRIRMSKDYFDDDWRFYKACGNSDGSGYITDNPVLEMPDGSQRLLICNQFKSTYSSNAHFVTKDNWAVTLIEGAGGVGTLGFKVIDNTGIQYTMNYRLISGIDGRQNQYVWYTTKIEDKNGNALFVDYNANSERESPIFDRIRASDGRTVTFTYRNKHTPNLAALRRISYGSRHIDYTQKRLIPDYRLFGGRQYRLLTSVDLPGTGTGKWTYAYHNRRRGLAGDNLLKTLTYPQGATTTYQYGYHCFLYVNCSRLDQHHSLVVASKVNAGRAVTPGTWRFTYSSTSDVAFDITKISGPTSIEEYRHHRVNRKLNLTVGYNNFVPQLWRVGLLAQKKIKSPSGSVLQTENYSYGKRRLSDEIYERAPYTQAVINMYDVGVYQHYLTQKKVTRNGQTYTTDYQSFTDNLNPHKITETGQATKVTYLNYYPRRNGQNIVNQIRKMRIGGSDVAKRRIDRTFDSRGNLLTETRFGVKTTYTYDSKGNITSVKNARNKTTRYQSYHRGIARTELKPEGVTIKRSVDTYGNITRVTDGRGFVTNYRYDSLNRPKGISKPIGSPININWTTSGRTLTRGGYVQRISFDGFGRTLCTQTENIYVGQAYDASGNRSYETYPDTGCGSSTRTRFTYDALHRPLRTTHPDKSYTEISYLNNNTQRLRDERGKFFTNRYRSYGDIDQKELIRVSGPEKLAMTISRNELGQVTAVKRNGVNRSYYYGSTHGSTIFLLSETNPETGTTTYGRDALGNLTSRKVGNSPITTYGYDGLNRLVLTNYPKGTPDISASYDKNNNLRTLNSGIAKLTYTYDPNNNLLQERQTIDNNHYFLSYTYTGLDHLKTLTTADGQTISYTSNDLGWPTKAAPHVTNINYDLFGRPTRFTFANGRTQTQSYLTRGWPLRTTVNGGIADRERKYDVAGNMTALDDRLNGINDRNLSYDNLNRLKTASGPWGSGSVSYSGNDDILSKSMGASLRYEYNSKKQVFRVSGQTFTYDVYGNITRKVNGSYDWRYSYDDASNLRSVVDKTGGTLRNYDYSGQKQRVKSVKPDETRVHIVSKAGKLMNEFVVKGNKPNITNVYVGSRLVAELESQLQPLPPTTIYGFGYGNSQHKNAYSTRFNLTTLPDKLKLCVNGYGINSATEVSVKVNGRHIGYLKPGGDPKESCFDLSPALLRRGTNTVVFTQAVSGQTWGVGIISTTRISDAAFLPAIIMLLLSDEEEEE